MLAHAPHLRRLISHRKSTPAPRRMPWLPLGAAALLVAGITFGLTLGAGDVTLVSVGKGGDIDANAHGVGRVEEVLRYIEAKYVDEVDREELVAAAVNKLLAELDPHSAYIPPEQLAGHRAQLEGSATGIGVDVLMIRDSVTVVSALPGGPADLAGLRAYDRIVAIGDSTVSGRGLSSGQVESWMASFGDEPLTLRVRRPGEGALLPVRLVRTRITVPSVARGVLLDGDVAYIRVRQFGSETYEEFMRELERLVDRRQAEHLIVDLRGNSGGYLNEAVQLLSQLFPQEGQLLVYTEGAHSARKDYHTTGRVFFPVNRVSVIIDRGSASASEIVAGAVKDWDRGTIVGQRSFGKGLVQELYPLKDGGALHITVSRYFTPSGRSIQRDYERLDVYADDLGDSLARRPDNTFATAGGRAVYGGGGIAPDVEVSSRSTLDEPAFRSLRPLLDNFVFENAETLRADTDRTELLERLRARFTAAGYAFSDADWAHYRPDLERDLALRLRSGDAAELSDASLATERLERARLRSDPYVEAALEAIRGPQARLLR